MGSKSTEGNSWTGQQGTTYVGQEQQKCYHNNAYVEIHQVRRMVFDTYHLIVSSVFHQATDYGSGFHLPRSSKNAANWERDLARLQRMLMSFHPSPIGSISPCVIIIHNPQMMPYCIITSSSINPHHYLRDNREVVCLLFMIYFSCPGSKRSLAVDVIYF